MLNADVYKHSVGDIELIETHISWVILTGDYAYKIKKPVNFGFLDFSTLDKRKTYCEQELHLNRRLAPEIYLEVVAITGSIESPVISNLSVAESKDILEYAVKMKQFPQSVQLDNMLQAGELEGKHINAIAQMIAKFHQSTVIADNSTDYGNPEGIYAPVNENFEQINESLKSTDYVNKLAELQQWSESEFARLKPVFVQRKQAGFIRECHGDMHLRNLVWLNGKASAFDCIEFNASLRWIDVMSDVAFLMMDLQDRGQEALANRFLNAYLEITGDYEGLSVLPYYLCYRAMVRAKVNALRIQQLTDKTKSRELTEFESYLQLALRYTYAAVPKLIIMRGLSASGKSTVSQQIVENTGAIRIRSDVERKRLFGLSLDKKAQAPNIVDQGIYSLDSSEKTYEKLLELAATIIASGNTVLVDAAFLRQEQWMPFRKLANSTKNKTVTLHGGNTDQNGAIQKSPVSRGVAFIIIEVSASFDVLRKRIIARKNDVSDADLTVLEHQILHWKPLTDDATINLIRVNTEQPLLIEPLLENIRVATH